MTATGNCRVQRNAVGIHPNHADGLHLSSTGDTLRIHIHRAAVLNRNRGNISTGTDTPIITAFHNRAGEISANFIPVHQRNRRSSGTDIFEVKHPGPAGNNRIVNSSAICVSCQNPPAQHGGIARDAAGYNHPSAAGNNRVLRHPVGIDPQRAAGLNPGAVSGFLSVDLQQRSRGNLIVKVGDGTMRSFFNGKRLRILIIVFKFFRNSIIRIHHDRQLPAAGLKVTQ